MKKEDNFSLNSHSLLLTGTWGGYNNEKSLCQYAKVILILK